MWQSLSGGGITLTDNDYTLRGTLGQTATRYVAGGGHMLENGFWSRAWSEGPCCIGIRGNADGDHNESIDVGDVTQLINYALSLTGPPPSCWEEGNVDGIGLIDISDITYLVNFMWSEGPAPPACP